MMLDFGFYNLDCMEGMKEIDSKSVSLIISDPPYYKVKGEFDFIWDSFDEYLEDVERWTIECKRILADNGTLFWYGHAKKIAYSQIILDKYFNLENNITIEFNRQTKKGVDCFRCFPPVTERLLMYSNEIVRTGLESIKLDVNNFNTLRKYFKDFQDALRLSKIEILKLIGQKADHCFRWRSSQWDLPTKETYSQLCELPKTNGFIRKEYEELRKEYEELRRPFKNIFGLFDVMSFDQEAHISGKINHDTVKPEKLTGVLILTCSNESDLIVVPFGGSGTECVMAEKLNRNYIGFEDDLDHFRDATKRLEQSRITTIDIFKEPKKSNSIQCNIFEDLA